MRSVPIVYSGNAFTVSRPCAYGIHHQDSINQYSDDEYKRHSKYILGRVKCNFFVSIKIPQCRIDELLFQEPTTRISAPNYMENQKAVSEWKFAYIIRNMVIVI